MTLTLFKLKRMTKLGARSLIEHKLRSFLTALGIIFGVASVIAMLAIGEGASYEARQQIRNMGSSNIIIRSRKPEGGNDSQARQHLSVYGLTYDDALRIDVLFPEVQVQVPSRIIAERIHCGSVSLPGRIVGTIPWYLKKTGMHVIEGRFLDAEDVRRVDNVVVLTREGARELFPLSWPIGRTVYLGTQAYVVVGVVGGQKTTSAAGASGGRGGSKRARRDVYEAYIPISAAKNRFGEILVKRETGSFQMEKVELHQLTVTAPSDEAVIPLARAIRVLLTRFHKQKDFEIVIPLELLKQAEATKRIFNIVLGSIAAISLLVGGIGIMNIMLASVTERTREIGVRRALGATRSDIVLQFLAEALLLSIAGGIVGVGLGIAIPTLVTHVAGLTTIIRGDALGMAFGISVATGIVFGIYPATRAAALSPIEALRHE